MTTTTATTGVQHWGNIEGRNGQWHAVCSCGWSAKPADRIATVRRQVTAHERTATR